MSREGPPPHLGHEYANEPQGRATPAAQGLSLHCWGLGVDSRGKCVGGDLGLAEVLDWAWERRFKSRIFQEKEP